MNRCTLITALFLLALGAFSLHLRIHPLFVAPIQAAKEVKTPSADIVTTEQIDIGKPRFTFRNFLAAFFAFIDLIIVTYSFRFKSTAAFAYLLNGMLAITGTVLMAHFTIEDLWGKGASLMDWLYLKSTLSDIIILGADFLVGKAVYDSYFNLPA